MTNYTIQEIIDSLEVKENTFNISYILEVQKLFGNQEVSAITRDIKYFNFSNTPRKELLEQTVLEFLDNAAKDIQTHLIIENEKLEFLKNITKSSNITYHIINNNQVLIQYRNFENEAPTNKDMIKLQVDYYESQMSEDIHSINKWNKFDNKSNEHYGDTYLDTAVRLAIRDINNYKYEANIFIEKLEVYNNAKKISNSVPNI